VGRILVVDDDAGLRRVLRDALGREGHDVATAADGREAAEALGREEFDLVITDLAMPRLGGEDLVREVRRRSRAPVLVLTVRSDEREKVLLLDSGADDYVVKPFGVAELQARVRALLRRRDVPSGVVHAGPLEVDLDSRRVRRQGEEVRLTPTEFGLLRTFLSKPGAVWTHRQLIAAVWGVGAEVSSDTLRVHVGSLRRKIEDDPDRPRLIVTEPWVGYRFAPDA
jgi:two-component system KDP operon response regulator KdpE